MEVCKLAGGIDVLTCLDFGGNQHFMVGHGKGEGIGVLGVVGERALEGVFSVRCRNGDALQVVVAIDAHGCGDQGTGIGGLWCELLQVDVGSLGERDGIAAHVLALEAGNVDVVVLGGLIDDVGHSGRGLRCHALAELASGIARTGYIIVVLNGDVVVVVANHIGLPVACDKHATEDVVLDDGAFSLLGNAIDRRGIQAVAEDVAVGDGAFLTDVAVESGNSAGEGSLSAILHGTADLAVLNDTIVNTANATHIAVTSFFTQICSFHACTDIEMANGGGGIDGVEEAGIAAIGDAVAHTVEVA